VNLQAYLSKNKKVIDRALDKFLPEARSSYIAKVMRYSVFAGGKRFRPALMLLVCEALSGKVKQVLAAACAVELIHTFTLIHDDLPCMDDDDYRRGKLTSHKKFGEDMATLAGDAMQALAYEILLKETKGVSLQYKMRALETILEAIGSDGVVTGQVLDIQSEGKKISLSALENIHLKKTAALIQAAVKAAAILCGASTKKITQLDRYAQHLGLSFQIADDLLDYTSSFAKMGKQPGSDKKQKKSTYVSLLGKEKARQLMVKERDQTRRAISFLGKKGKRLAELADFVIKRER